MLFHKQLRILALAMLASVITCLASCGSMPRTTVMLGGDSIATPSLTAVDHNLLTEVLARAVNDQGNINIDMLKGDASLTSYLEQLAIARLDVFSSRLAQLTFWINVYNAYVLDMYRHNPIKSSPEEIGRLKSAPVVIVSGKRFSLSDIESNLIKEFREPRMFFALVTGERGGPQFWQEAYVEERISDQLDRATRAFFADTVNSRLDKPGNTIILSNYVQGYQEHFVKAAGSVVGFIRAFAPPAMGEHIDQRPTVKVSYFPMDNTLRRVR